MDRTENEYVVRPGQKESKSSFDGIYYTKRKAPIQSVTVECSKEGEYTLADNDLQSHNDIYLNSDEKPYKKRTIVTENKSEEQKKKASLTIQKNWIIAIIIVVLIVIVIIAVALKMSLKSNESFTKSRSYVKNSKQIVPKWLSWDPWGECNSRCDGGKRTRSRTCSTINSFTKCEGVDHELQACNTEPCSHGSCCSVVLVDLNGPSLREYPELGGNYELAFPDNQLSDVYKNIVGSGWYLFKSANGYWQIRNPDLNSTKKIYHRTCKDSCPTKCSSDWLYWNKNRKTWKVDKLIQIKCEKHKCCTTLKLSDNGVSKHQWKESFGVYSYMEKDINGSNIYGHKTSKRYIVRDHSNNIWKIADGYGNSKSYYLQRKYPDGHYCPENATRNNWKYYDNDRGDWIEDRLIRLDCKNI